MVNSFWQARVEARSRDHGHMIERTALPAALLVDRALAAFGQHVAGRARHLLMGKGVPRLFEAASDIFRKMRVQARS